MFRLNSKLRRRTARFAIVLFTIVAIFAYYATMQDYTSYAQSTDSGYVTESFIVDIKVDKDCVYHVTENITVNFKEPRRGIFRYIPYAARNSKIENISVKGGDVDVSNAQNGRSKYKVIRIGDPDVTLTGRHKYVINYKIRGIYNDIKPLSANDMKSNLDEMTNFKSSKSISNDGEDLIYVDMLPTDWQTDINYVKATMTVPKDVDWSKLQLYGGSYGQQEDSKLDVRTDGKTMYVESLNWPAKSGVTAYLPAGKDYWQDYSKASDNNFTVYLIAICAAALSIFLWVLFGIDKKYVQTVEFYAPDNMTPMETGYVIDGTIDVEDRIANFFYAASRGYLKIEQASDESQGFIFHKTEYDQNKLNSEKSFVKKFVEDLFADKDDVYSTNIPSSFTSEAQNRDMLLIDYYTGKNRIYTFSSSIAQIVMGFILIATAAITPLLLYFMDVFETEGIFLFSAVFIDVVSILAMMISMGKLIDRKANLTKKKKFKLILIFAISFVVNLVSIFIIYVYGLGIHAYALIIILARLVSVIMIALMNKRTKQTTELVGKLMGFRDFIEKAELPMLEKLVGENPSYFYDVLPYAYVFGLTNKWVKNFEGINISKPDWYEGNADVPINAAFPMYMASSFSKMDTQLRDFISPVIAEGFDVGDGGSGSFGGFSGGGFSGGGFGGGGGGAW